MTVLDISEMKDNARLLWKQSAGTNLHNADVNMMFANLSTAQELAKKKTKAKRKALIVGINKYTGLGKEASLSGCVNDAKDFANTLLVLGFPPSRIKILTDEKATKAAIEKGLVWLVKDAKAGDVLIYYHSGHGSNKADLDGDETDRRDEMLITSNFEWDKPETHLTDDDLHRWLTGKTPEGVRIEVVLDTCHSGTGTRSLFRDSIDPPGLSTRFRTARFLPPPLEHRIRLNTMLPAESEQNLIGQKMLNETQNNVLWPACRYNQVAWEVEKDGEVRGVHTYNFCQILRRSNGNITRRKLFQLLAHAMSEQGYEQLPDLEVSQQNFKLYDLYPFRREIEDESSEVPEE